MVLGIAAGQRREALAAQREGDESRIGRAGQRDRDLGLAGLLADHRPGHSGGDLSISPVQRAQIVERAGREPVANGFPITHWSGDDLARQAVADGIVAPLSPRTVRSSLPDVDRPPHRTRYGKTAPPDGQFKPRAEQVLWCDAHAARLAEQGVGVVCVDEVPTFQVRERNPIRRAIPGSVEQQECDDTRHGTVKMLVFLVAHRGLRERAFWEAHDREHDRPELERFRQHHRAFRGVFLIPDGGPRHTAGDTQGYFARSRGWWRPRCTPANASGLDPAEILLPAFKYHDLRRASRRSKEEFPTHVSASWPEDHHRYAHPFEGTGTNHQMRQWFAKHHS